MIRKTSFAPGEYYHVYNRGVDKRMIFQDEHDYERFLILLYMVNSEKSFKFRNDRTKNCLDYFDKESDKSLVDICCYCLMPNHFHILLREKNDGGITKFIHKLCTSYSMYFNKKCERTGKLFSAEFKSEYIDRDNYLKYLFSYIHLNPVKLIDPAWKENGVKDFDDSCRFLNEYQYSSYLDYLGCKRKQSVIIEKTALPEYFANETEVKKEIFDWLNFKDKSI